MLRYLYSVMLELISADFGSEFISICSCVPLKRAFGRPIVCFVNRSDGSIANYAFLNRYGCGGNDYAS